MTTEQLEAIVDAARRAAILTDLTDTDDRESFGDKVHPGIFGDLCDDERFSDIDAPLISEVVHEAISDVYSDRRKED